MGTTTNIQAWSTTAADNDDADAGINWLEGQDPGTVNGSARGMMAAIRRYASDVGGGVTVGGTANAILITTGQAISAAQEAAGFSIRFKAANTNTGATTVNVDSQGVEAVERMDGTALSAGDIVAGGIYDIAYNATNGGYTLMTGVNPSNFVLLSAANLFTNLNTITRTSAGAATNALALVNSSNTVATETYIDFSSNTSGVGVRSAQIAGVNTNGSTSTALVFRTALGAAPAEVARFGAYSGAGSTGGFSVGSTTDPGFGNIRATAIELGHATDTTLTRASAGLIAVEGVTIEPGANRASFSASNSGTQAGGSSSTGITLDTEAYDVGSIFTSNGATPPAGTVFLIGAIGASSIDNGSSVVAVIYKDGAVYKYGDRLDATTGSGVVSQVVCMDQCSGSNVYKLGYASSDSSWTLSGDADKTYFQGTMI